MIIFGVLSGLTSDAKPSLEIQLSAEKHFSQRNVQCFLLFRTAEFFYLYF